MSSHPILRCAVLIFAILLAADASWCCELQMSGQTVAVTSADVSDDDDVAQVDCHACICSGLALIATSSTAGPLSGRQSRYPPSSARPASRHASVDVPPDERA